MRKLQITAALAVRFLAVAAQLSPGDAAACDCFVTHGNERHLFTHHELFDFRGLAHCVPAEHLATGGVTPLISDARATADAGPTSPFFDGPRWKPAWAIQNWNNSFPDVHGGDATLLRVNSPNNVYLEINSDPSASPREPAAYLTMRTARQGTFQSAAELESVRDDYQFASLRMYARTVGAPGACTAMFTYRAGSEPVQEADVEFLTHDPRNRAQYTNQPNAATAGDPSPTRNATLPAGVTIADWALHRLDWTPGRTVWTVNGETVSDMDSHVPRDPAQIMLNAWSDGGSWSGVMADGDEAFLQIQWIEVAFNVSGPGAGGGGGGGGREGRAECSSVCRVDPDREEGGRDSAAGISRVPRAILHVVVVLAVCGTLRDCL